MVTSNHRETEKTLDGVELRNAFARATRFLEQYKDVINTLNVFPVPDGDTGTNLLLTMKSVDAEAAKVSGISAEEVSAGLAKGALLGARGNSGVILSQFLQGIARGLEGVTKFNGKELAHALELGNQAAYRAVSRPVEGTMLTVIRELALAAQRQAEVGTGDVVDVWESALVAAREAVSRTPLQLPVLKEAGVVDAGGQGVAVILEGALRFLRKEDGVDMEMSTPILEDSAEAVTTGASPSSAFLTSTEEEMYGYEAVFMVNGEGLDVDLIREKLDTMGESVVVTGNQDMAKVHIHTADPGPVFSFGISLGTLRQITVENLDEQHQDFISLQRTEQEVPEVDILAVTWGDGFTKVFQSLGARGIVPTGEVMNPSAREILEGVDELAANEVIILPNNPNVIPVAEQAATLASKPIHVIRSRTLPQGIVAILAFNPDESAGVNVSAMSKALSTISTIAITKAIRSSSVKGVQVQKGGYIGLVDDVLVCSGRSIAKVLLESLQHADIDNRCLVTLFWGNGVSEAQAARTAKLIQKDFPNIEVESMQGAQPLYQYILSIE